MVVILVVRQFGNRFADGEICFIYCMKDNQGDVFHETDPMLGWQGERLTPCNSDGEGVPLLPYFRAIILFVHKGCQSAILYYRDSLTYGIRFQFKYERACYKRGHTSKQGTLKIRID